MPLGPDGSASRSTPSRARICSGRRSRASKSVGASSILVLPIEKVICVRRRLSGFVRLGRSVAPRSAARPRSRARPSAERGLSASVRAILPACATGRCRRARIHESLHEVKREDARSGGPRFKSLARRDRERPWPKSARSFLGSPRSDSPGRPFSSSPVARAHLIWKLRPASRCVSADAPRRSGRSGRPCSRRYGALAFDSCHVRRAFGIAGCAKLQCPPTPPRAEAPWIRISWPRPRICLGITEVFKAGGAQAIAALGLRHRKRAQGGQDFRPGQLLGDRSQTAGRARRGGCRVRFAGRPVRGARDRGRGCGARVCRVRFPFAGGAWHRLPGRAGELIRRRSRSACWERSPRSSRVCPGAISLLEALSKSVLIEAGISTRRCTSAISTRPST